MQTEPGEPGPDPDRVNTPDDLFKALEGLLDAGAAVEPGQTDRLLAAVLAKFGPVMLTPADFDAANPEDLIGVPAAPPLGDQGVMAWALRSKHIGRDGFLVSGYALMDVDANTPPPDWVAYSEDASDRLWTRTAGQWRRVEAPSLRDARARSWSELWSAEGPITPLVPAHIPPMPSEG